MTQGLPIDILEKRANEQRDQLQGRVVELRQTVKQRLDVKRNLREHVWPSAGAATLLGLALGFAVTGLFTRR
ncbi:MAG TPA: hypothetical protein VIX19_07935 [Terriglobales bacterium]